MAIILYVYTAVYTVSIPMRAIDVISYRNNRDYHDRHEGAWSKPTYTFIRLKIHNFMIKKKYTNSREYCVIHLFLYSLFFDDTQ